MATFKRKIFYLPGFDPRGAPFYHRLMHEQAAIDRARGGGIEVGRRHMADAAFADWTICGPGAETSYTCLRWEDLVRAAWVDRPLPLVAQGLAAYARNLARSDWPNVRRLPQGPLIALYYPLAALLLVPLLIALAVALPLALLLPGWLAAILGVAVAAVAGVPILVRMHVLWLIRLFIFNDRLARDLPIAGLPERLDRFAVALSAAVADPAWDEVLLVTHSNGSILAVPLVERLLETGPLPDRFAVVTLAHCIPLITLRRDAAAYRRSLARVAAAPVRWIDISFPPDGACTAGTDPFAPADGPRRIDLTLLSPRFFRFNDPAVYEARRKQKYELHFEYLRTGQRPSPIDILGLVAAPQPIARSIADFRAIA